MVIVVKFVGNPHELRIRDSEAKKFMDGLHGDRVMIEVRDVNDVQQFYMKTAIESVSVF